MSVPHYVDVLVIGGGQAGISAAFELRKRGFRGYAGAAGLSQSSTLSGPTRADVEQHSEYSRDSTSLGTYLVLDAETRPGGAWQHRWPSLTMATVNHIADLPGLPVGETDPRAEAADFVPTYFSEFEDLHDLPVLRPILVHSVRSVTPMASDELPSAMHDALRSGPREFLETQTTAGTFRSRVVVNCTGTWTRPFVPFCRGASSFVGRQYHTQDYVGAREFEGQSVMVVGGGISALSHLDDLGGVARETHWVTRTPPRWRTAENTQENREGGSGESGGAVAAMGSASAAASSSLEFGLHSDAGLTAAEGRAVEERVRARVEAGLRPLAVVAETGLPVTQWTRDLEERGLLDRLPMFDHLTRYGAVWNDGSEVQIDSIIWATGFRAELRHLAPLGLRVHGGGIVMDGTRVAADPRLHLIGYGPSASTVGARWAARRAVREIVEFLRS